MTRRSFLNSIAWAAGAIPAAQAAPPARRMEYGLWGAYYNLPSTARESDFPPSQPPELVRVDPQIAFAWGAFGPFGRQGRVGRRFAVRWAGFVKIKEKGVHTFHLTHSGAARLSIDNRTLDLGLRHSRREGAFAALPLEKPGWVPLELIFLNRNNRAFIALEWAQPGQAARTVVEANCLAHLPA